MIALLAFLAFLLMIVINSSTPPIIEEEVQEYPYVCVEKCYLVFGHTAEGKGVIHEIFANNSAEALDRVRGAYPEQRFNHVNLR